MIMKNPESILSKCFKKNAAKFKTYSYKITNDWQTSEDIVQELFINIFTNYSKEPADFYLTNEFIYRSLKFRSIDYLRKKKLEPIILDNIDEFVLDERMENLLEKHIIYGEVIDDMYEIINEYPQKEIEIFHRYYYEGQKLNNISLNLYISRYHVSKILKKIKQKLREELGKKHNNGVTKD